MNKHKIIAIALFVFLISAINVLHFVYISDAGADSSTVTFNDDVRLSMSDLYVVSGSQMEELSVSDSMIEMRELGSVGFDNNTERVFTVDSVINDLDISFSYNNVMNGFIRQWEVSTNGSGDFRVRVEEANEDYFFLKDGEIYGDYVNSGVSREIDATIDEDGTYSYAKYGTDIVYSNLNTIMNHCATTEGRQGVARWVIDGEEVYSLGVRFTFEWENLGAADYDPDEFTIQIDEGSVYEKSGLGITGEPQSHNLTDPVLEGGQTYNWRVRIDDLDWSEEESFTVASTPHPYVDYNRDPSGAISTGSTVNFESVSEAYIGDADHSWTFENATPSSSDLKQVDVIFEEAGDSEVTLTVIDGSNNSCTKSETVSTDAYLPFWQEIQPR